MSNQYRVEQDRDVVCLLDAGRLMAAPLGDRTRLDAALDAAAAWPRSPTSSATAAARRLRRARCAATLRRAAPGRRAVVHALFDLEPTPVDSDYELAFRASARRSARFVLVLTDLLEEAAARPLVEAVPVLPAATPSPSRPPPTPT